MTRVRRTAVTLTWRPAGGIGSMLHDWLTHLFAAGHSPSTVRAYCGHLQRFQRHHPELYDVTLHELEEYLALRRTTHAAESRKAIRAAFRSFYGWAYAEGLIELDPSASLPPIRIPRTVPRLADDDQLQLALLRATPRDRGMVLLGRMAGLRLTEIATLHTDHRQLDVLTIYGKGEKQRLVPINDDLMPALLELEKLQGPGYYFPGRTGPHLHPQSVNKIITRVTGTNPHSLRHAAATSAYANTHDLRAVQEFLGHSSLATTQRYLHTNLDQIRAAVQGARFEQREHLARGRILRRTTFSSASASLYLLSAVGLLRAIEKLTWMQDLVPSITLNHLL